MQKQVDDFLKDDVPSSDHHAALVRAGSTSGYSSMSETVVYEDHVTSRSQQ